MDRTAVEGVRRIIAEYLDRPDVGSLVPRIWVEENFPAVVAAAAEVPEHLRGGWIEDIAAARCVPVLPARGVIKRLFGRS